MLFPIRCAGILTVLGAVGGPAKAQELAPPGSEVSLQKVVAGSTTARTVKYYLKGGSPRLQALVRRVEWTENELSVVEQLQLLKLDTVVHERRLLAFHNAQLAAPYFPIGFFPHSIGHGFHGGSPLQFALTGQLAYAATPQAALGLIGYLEQQETLLDAELKVLPPQEKPAAQGLLEALRPRLAALPASDVPPMQPQAVVPAPAVPKPVAQNRTEVLWNGTWWAAEVVKTKGNRYFIHYTGWANSWDEWVGSERIRLPAAKP